MKVVVEIAIYQLLPLFVPVVGKQARHYQV